MNAIHLGNTLLNATLISKKVKDLILDKQLQFSKEKGRKISLEKTVERLLDEAYLQKLPVT